MTTSISPITKAQMSELISEAEGHKLSEVELLRFERAIQVSSMLWAGSVGDKLLCLWGLIPPTLLSDQAYLWLHTTEAAEEHAFVLVRRSQIELRLMLREYPRIVGHCEVGAARSIRWLKWLGAKFGEPSGPLVPFEIRSAQ